LFALLSWSLSNPCVPLLVARPVVSQGDAAGAFFHPCFVRNGPDMLASIKVGPTIEHNGRRPRGGAFPHSDVAPSLSR